MNSEGVTIQMKTLQPYVPMLLLFFIVLQKMILIASFMLSEQTRHNTQYLQAIQWLILDFTMNSWPRFFQRLKSMAL